ncbi:hypothetical protein [Neobacillus niacini]|nr:hypothetical protein [Neobacillus niacini]
MSTNWGLRRIALHIELTGSKSSRTGIATAIPSSANGAGLFKRE